MAWFAVDEDLQEIVSASCPRWNEEEGSWIADDGRIVEIPKGTIKKLTGKSLTCDKGPIEF